MNKFIIKLIYLITIFIVLLALKKYATPYYLGNRTFKTKLKYYQQNKDNINTVVFGSSRLFRQVNPTLLDSLLKIEKTVTFNFAFQAAFNPESYYLYEKFVKNLDGGDIKYAFLELQDLNLLTNFNAKTTQGSYWNTLANFKFSNDYLKSSNLPAHKNEEINRAYLNSFLYSFYDFSILSELFKSNKKIKGINGFYPLEKNMIDMGKKNDLRKRWNKFHSDTLGLINRIEAARKVEKFYNHKANFNETHYGRLIKLISISRIKGIHLFLILPPRLTERQYRELAPLFVSLPKENVIEICEYETHKDLYNVKNSFDIGHFNNNGANIFTKYLAEKVNQKLNTPLF
jgi:hypothetical protein